MHIAALLATEISGLIDKLFIWFLYPCHIFISQLFWVFAITKVRPKGFIYGMTATPRPGGKSSSTLRLVVYAISPGSCGYEQVDIPYMGICIYLQRIPLYCVWGMLLPANILSLHTIGMKWITKEKPKIDRIACPWLIKRFIDKDAEIIYVPFDRVIAEAKKLGATPFDIPNVEFTHYDDGCTFDYFVEKYKIIDPAIHTMAIIVRGADTDRHDIASQANGLWAISSGLAYNHTNDHELLEKGMLIYDALYSWAKFLQQEKHMQHP